MKIKISKEKDLAIDAPRENEREKQSELTTNELFIDRNGFSLAFIFLAAH